MTVTALPSVPDRFADHAAGLRYLEPIGPVLPSLNAAGLGYVRDDLLARAAGAEAQGQAALDKGDWTLHAICNGTARACRETATQIVTYALKGWGVLPD